MDGTARHDSSQLRPGTPRMGLTDVWLGQQERTNINTLGNTLGLVMSPVVGTDEDAAMFAKLLGGDLEMLVATPR